MSLLQTMQLDGTQSLRQAAIATLQRQHGNQFVQRQLRATAAKKQQIQRDDDAVTEMRWLPADSTRLFQGIRPDVITFIQASRVAAKINAFSESDYAMVRRALDSAASDMEWRFICKAIAANRSAADIESFAATIQGMSERWLLRNLNVVDTSTTAEEEGTCRVDGGGIMQQYGNSCGPTSVQVVRGQTDPIYALSLRSAGPIDTAPDNAVASPETITNAPLASEQSSMLTTHNAAGTGNMPTNRSNPAGGAWVESDLNALSASTGYVFTNYRIGSAANQLTVGQALITFRIATAIGISVPITVGANAGDTAHYVMVMQASGNRYQIHDVATGETVWRTADQFNNSQLNLPSGHVALSSVDVPGPPPTPASP